MVLLERDGSSPFGLGKTLDDASGWSGELVKYIILMGMAAFGAAVGFGALTLNSKPPREDDWRWRTIRSSFALFVINILAFRMFSHAVEVLMAGESSYKGGGEDHWISAPAHIFLQVVALGCTLVSDILYVKLFGCCIFFARVKNVEFEEDILESGANRSSTTDLSSQSSGLVEVKEATGASPFMDRNLGNEKLKGVSVGQENDTRGINQGELNQERLSAESESARNDTRGTSTEIMTESESPRRSGRGAGSRDGNRSVHLSSNGAPLTLDSWLDERERWVRRDSNIRPGLKRWDTQRLVQLGSMQSSGSSSQLSALRSMGGDERMKQRSSKGLTAIQGSSDLEDWGKNREADPFGSSSTPSTRRNLSSMSTDSSMNSYKLRRWDTKRLINQGLDSQKYGASFVSGRGDGDGLEVAAKPTGVIGVVSGPSCAMPQDIPEGPPGLRQLKGVLSISRETDLDEGEKNSDPMKSIWNTVREEEGVFRYSVWIKSAVATSVCVLIYTTIAAVDVTMRFVDQWDVYRTRISDHLTVFDDFLVEAGWAGGVHDAKKNFAVKVLLYLDSLVPIMKWTSLVGFPVGLMIGLYSLYAIMVQHKRLSLAVAVELQEFTDELSLRSDAGVEELNPWPGIEKKYPVGDSTYFLAILTSTAVIQLYIFGVLIALILAMILNIPGLKLLLDLFGFYVLAYAIIFAIDLIVMRLIPGWLVSDGLKIKHPRWFFFYMMVFSSVHLVIGLLYALFRVIYLGITTVLVMNRLDINLFTAFKSLDNGHNAFMSMLVLTHLIQMDTHVYRRRATMHDKNQKE
ncbi:hypothetical protein BSKO_04209 [Bryopsis sp. KO-2023]|nr:hypothetical protein BSKO_04209 [Bryopsis sp. KO-2023]